MEFYCKSISDTQKLAELFSNLIAKNGCFASFYGEIGAGKTAFIKFLLKKIGVKEAVTSPSFVILNEYHHKTHLDVYHFDLYRLEVEGLNTIKSELVEYSKEQVITLVEWANFGDGELPLERVNISVHYDFENGETARIFKFEGIGQKYEKIVANLKESWVKS